MRIRVVRLLVYEGEAEWVHDMLDRRGVKEKMSVGRGSITEGWLNGRAGEITYAPLEHVAPEESYTHRKHFK